MGQRRKPTAADFQHPGARRDIEQLEPTGGIRGRGHERALDADARSADGATGPIGSHGARDITNLLCGQRGRESNDDCKRCPDAQAHGSRLPEIVAGPQIRRCSLRIRQVPID
jgi:hypothetical protein